jgi:hypothetical protein
MVRERVCRCVCTRARGRERLKKRQCVVNVGIWEVPPPLSSDSTPCQHALAMRPSLGRSCHLVASLGRRRSTWLRHGVSWASAIHLATSRSLSGVGDPLGYVTESLGRRRSTWLRMRPPSRSTASGSSEHRRRNGHNHCTWSCSRAARDQARFAQTPAPTGRPKSP